ncbi:LysM peptidoglycan-binding domain-containing protein [Hoeflea prorocentri]|uniref:LysM peptidoglycan-binding domain-containing protein n=1 Tax=Hoeflea prorocentri TaxID=1922333 RepID=A0A9X3UIS2_9HYPH|nr:LysM peptidoglycan-binding domain-containing protein [Hoeflea prorocentri]MCY6381429.1 LysM peptidoglycan-binding domain-containing protein [Hoeflea prorocentri]MDA5399229.1 LysM peptidoglycan-binding domain-containing protein [Hoeflea prorocentri]
MNKNKSLVWALVGLVIIILVGVYVYQTDPFAEPQQTATEEQAPAGTDKTAEKSDDATEEPAESAGTQAAPEVDEASDSAKAEQAPTFDVVRVEPDGSTLVAGQAVPGTKVQIVNNGQVIAEADAGASGDFVAVVEDALKPGDHEIVLRSLGSDETAAQSEEVATISVPEDEPTELLVMVTKPGEASRILTKPEGQPEAKAEAEVAAAQPAETAVQEDANSEPAADAAMTKPAQEEGQETASASTGSNEQSADETATQAAASEPAASSEGTAEGSKVASAEADTGKEEAVDQAAAPASDGEEKVAMASAEPDQKSEAVVAVEPALRIDAVEIEGGRMFVAGSATPGAEVSVFANGEPLGTSRVSPTGRFLVEADKDIAVGDHTISADLTMRGNVAPAMRVAVPFTRPEGELVAAVAAAETATSSTDEKQTDTAGTASETQAAQTPAKSADAAADMSAKAEIEPVQNAGAGGQAATAEQTGDTVADVKPEAVVEQGSADDSAASASVDEPAENVEVAAAPAEDETETVVQAALEPRDSSVIIRRGDTLWQISRRIYGRGVRYTTIYLANADQIKNPDMIEPGQIFAVPDEPLDNAEELHRERIRAR